MPALANRKHELFAQALARGETADAAYKGSGFQPNRGNATRLKANENIAARVTELQERAAIKVELTKADIVQMLVDDRQMARDLKQPSAAASASFNIAKVLGFVTDKKELTGKDGGAIEYADVTQDAERVGAMIDQLVERATVQ